MLRQEIFQFTDGQVGHVFFAYVRRGDDGGFFASNRVYSAYLDAFANFIKFNDITGIILWHGSIWKIWI